MGELSYELHTGRELELMLRAEKPLSMFYEFIDPPTNQSTIPENEFQDGVDKGRFTKGEYVREGQIHPLTRRSVKLRYVFYALTEEAWRIPAMVLVLKTISRTRNLPDEGLDRMTGSLLGYSDIENDEYIASANRY